MAKVNQEQRASLAWPVLAEVAANQSTITYGDLAKRLGIHHRPVRHVLGEIQEYCMIENLPPITILVVGKSGIPSKGFIALEPGDFEPGFDSVYSYPWNNLENPFGFASDGTTLASIAAAILSNRLSPLEAYARVKVRGMAQLVFRETLLSAYGEQCAVSTCCSSEILEAAHIVPCAKAGLAERVNPRNGLLLSAIHHRFFDLGWMTINEDYSVATDLSRTRTNSLERKLLTELKGTKLRLPVSDQHWPDPELIRKRNQVK